MRSRLIFAVVSLAACFGCSESTTKEVAQPDSVVFKDSTGRTLTIADLRTASGSVRWEMKGGAPIPPAAERLHQQARTLGGQGKYQEAIRLLQEAAGLAPDWPYPPYDLAYTHLLTGNDDEALAGYERVDRLAPDGFFTTKVALWALRGEAVGIFAKGTYRDYLSIEWVKDDSEKRHKVDALLKRAPKFAPAWKASALLQEKSEACLADLERGLSLDPDPETHGMLLLNKATTLHSVGRRDESIKLLGELSLAASSTVSTRALAKVTLATLLGLKK